jgi:hypothetical protein
VPLPIGEDLLEKGSRPASVRLRDGGDAAAVGVPRQPLSDRSRARLRQTTSADELMDCTASPIAFRSSTSNRRARSEVRLSIDWKSPACSRPRCASTGPIVLSVHMASVWVPFTSESEGSRRLVPRDREGYAWRSWRPARRLGVFMRHNRRVADEERALVHQKYIRTSATLQQILRFRMPARSDGRGPQDHPRAHAQALTVFFLMPFAGHARWCAASRASLNPSRASRKNRPAAMAAHRRHREEDR